MTDGSLQERLRRLPAVDRIIDLLQNAGAPRAVLAGAVRRAIDDAREEIRSGGDIPGLDEIVSSVRAHLREHEQSLLRPVINATGVLIHTNLGRVPLGSEQLDAVTEIASGYSNLEYDLAAGSRGSRYAHAAPLLAQASGAESGLVVNNNAAAVLLVLAGLCAGREVIISRGELIEIGGEFRIPEVMSISGAELVEVGTTNRTHLADFEKAITDRTAAILKVHPSNYQVVGFTASVEGADLARLARGRGVHFVHDLGSGLLGNEGAGWARDEPRVSTALQDGADIVTFSGDKLLGGPQAGLIVGRGDLIDKLREHALIRALRVDKMTLAALEATLRIYLEGRTSDLPLWSMASAAPEELRKRAERITEQINQQVTTPSRAESVPTLSVAGGGSLPGVELESWAISLAHPDKSAAELARSLRYSAPPVIARVEENRVLLDLRTVPESQDETLVGLVASVLGR